MHQRKLEFLSFFRLLESKSKFKIA